MATTRAWDADGREYLDTMSGSAGPAMVGHANSRVAAAVAEQMARLPTTNILHQSDAVIAYCAPGGVTPPGLTKTALLAGGGDAVEAAVKLAMRAPAAPRSCRCTAPTTGCRWPR